MKFESVSISKMKSDMSKWATVCLVSSAPIGASFVLVEFKSSDTNGYVGQPKYHSHELTEPRDRNRIMRLNEVCEITGISSSTIRRLEFKGQFPNRRSIGLRAVGWLESEVLTWISESYQRVHVSPKERATDADGMIKSPPRFAEVRYE